MAAWEPVEPLARGPVGPVWGRPRGRKAASLRVPRYLDRRAYMVWAGGAGISSVSSVEFPKAAPTHRFFISARAPAREQYLDMHIPSFTARSAGKAKLPKTKEVEEWSSSNQKLCVATTLPPLQVCLPVCFWWHTMDDSVQPLPLPAPPPPVPPPSAPPPSAIAEPLPTSIITVKPIGSTVAERIIKSFLRPREGA